MVIAIKSEVDSRVILYPLMKVLKSYGTIIVISSNRQLNRLIDDEVEGGFRNIRVIVEESGATDDIYEDYGIADGDYDFVVLDNMGALEYDALVLPLGSKHTESFDDEIKLLCEEEPDKIVLVQYGKTSKNSKRESEKEKKSSKRTKVVETKYDPAEKFRKNVEDKRKANIKSNLKPVQVPFPSYQEVEDVEAEHRFYDVPSTLVNVFYDMLKSTIAVEKIQFQKEVRKKDESSGYIKSRNSTR